MANALEVEQQIQSSSEHSSRQNTALITQYPTLVFFRK